MFDERAFIAGVEAANVEELRALLRQPTAEQETALRHHLGDRRYQRMHSLAIRGGATRAADARAPRGNVVVLHGIMGGELSAFDRGGASHPVWVKATRLISGWLDRLRLSDDGLKEFGDEYDVRATGIMKREYGELLLSLAQTWNVRAFWFDWRKDLKIAADALAAQLAGWFGEDAPAHLVAHSMGGLVARTFIKRHPQRWRSLWDERSNGARGGRLVMLGTPNHGSFAIPQVMTGLEGLVRKLALFDLRHDVAQLLPTLNSFVGSYQMLPSPIVMPKMQPLYSSETYGELKVPQRHLDTALRFHEWIADVVDPRRMIYVAGSRRPTFSNITDLARLDSSDAYEVTIEGDGRVTHTLGRLRTADGEAVPTYYVDEGHGDLPSNSAILAGLDELLKGGETRALATAPPAQRGAEVASGEAAIRTRLLQEDGDEEKQLIELLCCMQRRGVRSDAPAQVSRDDRHAEELLVRGFLGSSSARRRAEEEAAAPFEPATIRLAVVQGLIEDTDALAFEGEPIDAVAVGHYRDVKPQAAELALDRAISLALARRQRAGQAVDSIDDRDLLLSQYAERGTIRGELGEPFFLSDPRVGMNGGICGKDRVIALAGMGRPGRFGAPELTVLARELVWALGRMGKRHLATVLIGAGQGNLDVRDAVSAWIRGIKNALSGCTNGHAAPLACITFVERDGAKLRAMQEAILHEKEKLGEKNRLKIEYDRLDDRHLREIERHAEAEERRARERDARSGRSRRDDRAAEGREPAPTRITLELERGEYRFGAITDTASIPERVTPLNPTLVMQANDELAAEWDRPMQIERGQFLEQLLVPAELRPQLFTDAPLVMLLDATTARIHWEMVARTDLAAGDGSQPPDSSDVFLGMGRGLTRQLRSVAAPPPEPPPPPLRVLRVLVVADPAEDAPLPGAEQEGAEIVALFEAFNRVYGQTEQNRIELVPLLGPREATWTNVLRHLMRRRYDVLHFAGHCVFDKRHPAASGWIFTGRQRLTANELNRIDRIPKFVFSNACESGVIPGRAEQRSDRLAPTFAESFFARGVGNFVCTAWPVDDAAARLFAMRVYAGLLGLTIPRSGGSAYKAAPRRELMYQAMREARLLIASFSMGSRSWGAYQHYGNPYFRFFDAVRKPQRADFEIVRSIPVDAGIQTIDNIEEPALALASQMA